ncbi:hypothetical protein THAOC_21859, partial [Thalassiosira oceanica]
MEPELIIVEQGGDVEVMMEQEGDTKGSSKGLGGRDTNGNRSDTPRPTNRFVQGVRRKKALGLLSAASILALMGLLLGFVARSRNDEGASPKARASVMRDDDPSSSPSIAPSLSPSVSGQPSLSPSARPTISEAPSSTPSGDPSLSKAPSSIPSGEPSLSRMPSSKPSSQPSTSNSPTLSFGPTQSPSNSPSKSPTTSPTTSSPPTPAFIDPRCFTVAT